MQPISGANSKGALLSGRSTQAKQQSVNSEAFWRMKADEVAVDEVFFHKYFSKIGKGKQVTNSQKVSRATKDLDDEDSKIEDEIWQALVDSKPEVEGHSDIESDLEMLDLDVSEMESSLGDDEIDDGGEEGENSDDLGNMILSGFAEESGSERDTLSESDELFQNELQLAKEHVKDKESSRQKKRKLKNLPTFAAIEDYAEMLEKDEDEDKGVYS